MIPAQSSAEVATDAGEAEAPVALRVVSGHPTAEELAALVAVLAARGGGQESAPEPRNEWTSRARLMRAPLAVGQGQWRSSVWAR